MNNPLRRTFGAMKRGAISAKDFAEKVMGDNMEGGIGRRLGHTPVSTGTTIAGILSAVNAAAAALSFLRYLDEHIDTRPLLRRIGLGRRRSLLGTAMLVGVGAVAGAGIAMFVLPRSGRDTRRGLARGLREIGRRGREILESAGSELGFGEEEEGQRERGREGTRAGEQKAGEKPGEGTGRQEGARIGVAGGPESARGNGGNRTSPGRA